MKVEEIRELAKGKKIPNHMIDRFLSQIEVDENGDVKDEAAVLYGVHEVAHNVAVVRGNLEAVQKMRANRADN